LHQLVKEETNYSRGLDKFIEEQIEKHKQGYIKPAAEGDFDPEIITETMAKVFEMQKKYQKAIKAYEVLALKIPEKNDFFAARINYLKNII
jgi:chorismate mutase